MKLLLLLVLNSIHIVAYNNIKFVFMGQQNEGFPVVPVKCVLCSCLQINCTLGYFYCFVISCYYYILLRLIFGIATLLIISQ